MLTVKICVGPDVRRFRVDGEERKVYAAIREAAMNSFGISNFLASYVDEEGDTCMISGPEEMLEAIRLSRSQGKHLKIRLLEAYESSLSALEEKVEETPDEPESKVEMVEIPRPEPEPEPQPEPEVKFVRDVTLPDESLTARGTVAHKVWRIQNSGSSRWPENCTIQGHGCEEKVPALSPTEQCDVALSISLPERAGRFRQGYKLQADPTFKGDTSLWIDVHIEKPSALFIRDVKLNDGVTLETDQLVTKTWAFKNDGSLTWPQNSQIVFETGSLIPVERKVVLPEAKAGETALISVDLRTPAKPGSHRAVFHLCTADGKPFANHFQAWCSMDVQSPKPKVSKADFLTLLPDMMEDPDVREAAEAILRLPAMHAGTFCNACGVAPICGIRFKCSMCEDYDLCEACEAKDIHPDSHTLLKMKRPQPIETQCHAPAPAQVEAKDSKADVHDVKELDAKFESDVSIPDGSNVVAGSSVRKTWRVNNTGSAAWPEGTMLVWTKGKIKIRGCAGVAASCEAGSSVDLSVDVLIPFKSGRHTGHFRLATASGEQFGDQYFLEVNVTQEEFKLTKLAHKANKRAAKAAKQAAKRQLRAAKQEMQAKKQAFKSLKKNAQAEQKQAKKQQKKVKAEFVEDVSLADGSVIDAGAVLHKVWRLRNSGEVPWPQGTVLMFMRGDFIPETKSVPVACEPGATVEVAMDLTAPSEPGRAKAFFRLALPSGRKLPLKLWLEAIITPPSSSEDDSDEASSVVNHSIVVTPVDAPTDEEAAKVAHLQALGFTDTDMLLSLLRAAAGDQNEVGRWLTAGH